VYRYLRLLAKAEELLAAPEVTGEDAEAARLPPAEAEALLKRFWAAVEEQGLRAAERNSALP